MTLLRCARRASMLVVLGPCALGCSPAPPAVAAPVPSATSAAPTASAAPAELPVVECGPGDPSEACKRACDAGLAKSCLRLGQIRVGAVAGWDRYDAKEAGAALTKACHANLAEACTILGVLHGVDGQERDYPKAAGLFRKACDAGRPGGCGHLAGLRLGSEPGVEAESAADIAAAVALLEKACKDGHAHSCTGLAREYLGGWDVKKDPKRGLAVAEQGCRSGDPESCEIAAQIWGGGGPGLHRRDAERVMALWKRAVDLTSDSCEQKLAQCPRLARYYEMGVARWGVPDELEAIGALRRGCVDGKRPGACRAWGIHLLNKPDPKQWYTRAHEVFELACQGGDAEGCFQFGKLYKFGHGVPVDHAKACAWRAESCRLGFAEGCDRAGQCYHDGVGVPKDDAKALVLRRRGCDWRSIDACRSVGAWLVIHDGKEVATGEGFKEAVQLFTRGCKIAPYDGCWALALVHARGWGVPKSAAEAADLGRRACKAGGEPACNWLRNPRKVPKWVEIRDAEDAKRKAAARGARP